MYLLLDHGMMLFDLFVHIWLHHFQIINRVADHSQRVTQLVTHAASQLPEHGQFFLAHQFIPRLAQLARPFIHHFFEMFGIFFQFAFRLLALGDISGDSDGTYDLTVGITKWNFCC